MIESKLLIYLLVIGYASANFCTDDSGYWLSSVAQGVTDFSYGGSRLNSKYYCFEGCLNTGTALQNYKIDLSGKNGTKLERSRSVKDISAHHAQFDGIISSGSQGNIVIPDDDDPNAESCVDPVLRQDVKNALQKTTQNSCKNIVNTLVLNLNRPGWAITCIRYNDFAIDDSVSDMNFCSYDAGQFQDYYTIRLAKLDMS